MKRIAFALALVSAGCTVIVTLTQHNDNARTGVYTGEQSLTASAVRAQGMRVKYSRSVDGWILAQPLYARSVAFPDGRTAGLFVVTDQNKVYAFDPDANVQKWSITLADSDPGRRPLPRGWTSPPSTPVIDLATNTMYVLFSTKNQDVDGSEHEGQPELVNLDVAFWLVALDIRTGTELRRARVAASARRSNGSTLEFTAKNQVSRTALLLDHGSIYFAFGSRWLEGASEFHGWVMRYDAQSLRAQGSFCTSVDVTGPCDFRSWRCAAGAGIWQGGGGLAADADGAVYFSTGNGRADAANRYYGDSFVKLRPSGDALVYDASYSPPNADLLNTKDLDLGSGGVVVIPDTSYLVGGGKTGMLYLIDRRTMTLVQSFQAFTNTYHPDWTNGCPSPPPAGCADWEAGPHLHGSPSWWRGPEANFGYLYHWGEKDHPKMFKLNLVTGRFDQEPVVGEPRATETLMPGGMISLSSNGNNAGSGVVWALLPAILLPDVLFALDPQTLQVLWSGFLPTGMPKMGKWMPPTVADGKVIVATTSRGFVVYEMVPARIPGRARELALPVRIPPPPPDYHRLFEGFESEQAVAATGNLRRQQLAPPSDQAVLYAASGAEPAGDRLEESWTLGIDDQVIRGTRQGSLWQAEDGSRVIAEEVRSVPAPQTGLPPWQLFKVVSHEGKGRLDSITYIQRVDTFGRRANYLFFAPRR